MRAPLRLGKIVRADDDACSPGSEASHAAPDVLPPDGIEPGGRLVEKDQSWRVGQGGGQLKTARPPARELSCSDPGVLRKFELVDDRLGRRPRPAESVDLGAEAQILEHGQVGVEGEPLRHVAHVLADLPRAATEVEPEHVAMPLVRAEYPREYPKRRGLPATVCSDEAEDLAGPKRERDTLDRHAARIPLSDALESDEELRGMRRRDAARGRACGHGGSRSPRTCTSSPPLPARPRSRRAQGSAGVRRGQARWPRSPCCRDGPR